MTRKAKKRRPDRFGRVTVQVQLYANRPDDQALLNIIDDLKADKAFRGALREGLRLYADKRANRIRIIDAALLDEFRVIVENAVRIAPQAFVPAPPVSGGLKSLNSGFQVQSVVYDDEDTVVVRRDDNAANKIMGNFLDSVFGLQKEKGGDNDPTG